VKIILIVDDSLPGLQMLSTVLKAKNFEVLEASDGFHALQILDSLRVDMVITDLIMPCMNGIELIGAIRSRSSYRAIPILMLTTQTNQDLRKMGEAAGATCWIDRPFSTQSITAVIRKCLHQTEGLRLGAAGV
jgi:two-component system, chemotaxis family, chemotaxis protein CheY